MTNSEKKLKEKRCIDKIIHTYKKKKTVNFLWAKLYLPLGTYLKIFELY